MAEKNKDILNCQVEINHYESVCLFLGCKVQGSNIKDENDELLNKVCRCVAAEHYPFNPQDGEIVGVYLNNRQKWARGQILDVYLLASNTEYKIFLLDYGEYVKVSTRFLVQLNKYLKYPPQHLKLGLDGVVPVVTFCQGCKRLVQNLLDQGTVYFLEKRRISDIIFGDVLIKPADKAPMIDLSASLLEKGVVRRTDNFEEDIKHVIGFEDVLNQQQTTNRQGNKNHYAPQVNKEVESDNKFQMKERRCLSPEKATTDTGYSSEDERPVAHEDTMFVPPGYHIHAAKKTVHRNSRKEIKWPRTYYEILRDKDKSREKQKHQTEGLDRFNKTSENHVASQISTKDSYKFNKQQDKNVMTKSAVNIVESQPLFKSKSVCWSDITHEDNKSSTCTERLSHEKRRRTFNLNWKSGEQIIKEDQTSEDISKKNINIEYSSVNHESKESVHFHTDELKGNKLLQNSTESSLNSSKDLSGSPNANVLITSIDSPTNVTSINELSKKQRLKLKYRAKVECAQANHSITQPVMSEYHCSITTIAEESVPNFIKNKIIQSNQDEHNSSISSLNDCQILNNSKNISVNSSQSSIQNVNMTSNSNISTGSINSSQTHGSKSIDIDTGSLNKSQTPGNTSIDLSTGNLNSSQTPSNTNIESGNASCNIVMSSDSSVLSKKQLLKLKYKNSLTLVHPSKRLEPHEEKNKNCNKQLDCTSYDEPNSTSSSLNANQILNTSKNISGNSSQNSLQKVNTCTSDISTGSLNISQTSVNTSIESASSSCNTLASSDSSVLSKKQKLRLKYKNSIEPVQQRELSKPVQQRELSESHAVNDNKQLDYLEKVKSNENKENNISSQSGYLKVQFETKTIAALYNVLNEKITKEEPNEDPNYSTNIKLTKRSLLREEYEHLNNGTITSDENTRAQKSDGLKITGKSQNSINASGNVFKYFSKEVDRHQKINDIMEPSIDQLQQNLCSDVRNIQSPMKYLNKVGVLLHTKDDKNIVPVTSLSDSCLNISVVKAMQRIGLRELSRIQMFSYPVIGDRFNMVMITPPESGQIPGYAVPITSNLLEDEFYLKLPRGNGPRAIVVTPYWSSGENVAYLFRNLSDNLRVIHSHGGGAELEIKVELLEGCDVLVSTPKCLMRLLDNWDITSLNRLCHLVLDDADILLDKFKPEMERLIVHVNMMEQERENSDLDVELQVIISTTKWTVPLEILVTHILDNPVICFASQLQACVYSGIKPTAIFVESRKKIEKLVEILEDFKGKKRIVMCKSKTDVQHLYRLLIDLGMQNVLAAHEDLSSVNISEIPKFWEKSEHVADDLWKQNEVFKPIMVRSDEVLEEVPVTDAQVLIHYNMPNSLKTFGLRFTCLNEHYRNALKKGVSYKKCDVFILIDEENDLEVPDVMKFMKDVGTVLPEPIERTLEKILVIREQNKITKPLCENIKQFGKCWNTKKCQNRHILSKEQDHPEDIPRSGLVKILIQHVHNACHYSARLLEYSHNKTDWQKFPSEIMVLSVKMNNYFGKHENLRLHGFPSVGDIVAVETSVGVFQRAVILKISSFNKDKKPEKVDLRLIDNGNYGYNILVSQLLSLPSDMQTPPPAVVDIYLCNLIPKDLDISWSSAMTNWVQSHLREARRDSPEGYLLGKIVLSLGKSLWLDPLKYEECLPLVGTIVNRFSLRQDLLNTNNAINNPDHITTLRKLCEKAGIAISKEELKPKKLNQVKPTWAWLPQDESVNVHLVTAQALDVIFIQLTKFSDCLMKLMQEIQEAMKIYEVSDCASLLGKGDVCLGRSPEDNMWNRALINNKLSDDQVELFFVDYGDVATVPWTEVAAISDDFITKLNFQAIECNLAAVQLKESNDSSWEDEVINQMMMLASCNEEAPNLQVKVCGVQPEGTLSKGRKYKIILTNPSCNPVIVINKELLTFEMVQCLEEELHFLEYYSELNTSGNLSDDSELDSEYEKENFKCRSSRKITTTNMYINDDKQASWDKIIKDLEAGNFEIHGTMGLFPELEVGQTESSDADVSENHSEGSVSSLLQSRALPLSFNDCMDERVNSLDVQDFSSQCLNSSSYHSSMFFVNESEVGPNKVVGSTGHTETHSATHAQTINEDGANELMKHIPKGNSLSLPIKENQNNAPLVKTEKEVCQVSDNVDTESIQYCKPWAHSSPKYESSVCKSPDGLSVINMPPTTPLNISAASVSYSSASCYTPLTVSSKHTVTGIANCFSGMLSRSSNSTMSNNSYAQLNLVEKVKPFLDKMPPLKTVCDDHNTNTRFCKELESNKLTEDNSTHSVSFIINSSDKENSQEADHMHTSTGTVVAEENVLAKHEQSISEQQDSKIRDNIKGFSDSFVFAEECRQVNKEKTVRKWFEETVELGTLEENMHDNADNSVPPNVKSGGQKTEESNALKRYPLVLWHQDNSFVWLYIKLPAITDYTFTYDTTSIHFSAVYDQLPYKFSLELNAAHKKETVQYSPKAFHFEVRLEKVLKGKKFYWPRLTKTDEKLHWLKLNVEKAFEDTEETDDEDIKQLASEMPLWNDNPTDFESLVSDSSSLINSELST